MCVWVCVCVCVCVCVRECFTSESPINLVDHGFHLQAHDRVEHEQRTSRAVE
jgi:hypothetical protein